MIYIVRFTLLFLHLVLEENRSRNIVKHVVQESLKAAVALRFVSILIRVFASIKENINDGLLKEILSFDLKVLNII